MTVTLPPKPTVQAVVGEQTCQFCGLKKAVVDAQTGSGPWAYLCLECLRDIGTTSVYLMTNITSEKLEIDWI